MKKPNILLIILVTFFLISCNNNNIDHENVIARIDNAVLTKNDINEIFALNKMDNEDSSFFVKNYVKIWVVQQILKQKAEKYLNDIDKARIEKLVSNYRKDLFVNKYKQLYINQKLDTSITDTELVKFYNTYNFDYLMKKTAIKGIEIKVPKKSRKYYDLLNKMRNADDNYLEIKKICNEFKYYYNDFNDNWVSFEHFEDIYNISSQNLKKGKLYTTTSPNDSSITNMLYISDLLLKGDTIPFELAKENLKKIILHKRKNNLLNQLVNNTYIEALNQKNNYINQDYVINEN